MKTPTLSLDRLRRRRPDEDVDDIEEPRDPEARAGGDVSSLGAHVVRIGNWTGVKASVTRAFTGLLLLALVSGPIAFGLVVLRGLHQSPPVIERTSSGSAGTANDQAAAGAFAQDFVTTWLTSHEGEENRLDRFLSDTSQVSLPQTAARVSGVTVSGITSSEGVWSVTVSAVVAQRRSSMRQYFQVPVDDHDGSLVALSLPTPVAAPALGQAPTLDYLNPVSVGTPVWSVTQNFLTADLTGGDVTPLTSPGTVIRPVSPAPYRSVAMQSAEANVAVSSSTPKTGDQVRELVTADAIPVGGSTSQAISVEYALTLTARAGRWEVTAVDATPQIQGAPTPSANPSPTTNPAPTTSPAPTGSPSRTTTRASTTRPSPTTTRARAHSARGTGK